MFSIKILNKISAVGLSQLSKERYTVGEDESNPDGVLVRSADMLSYEFGSNLRGIARAGAGVNNIPIDRCSEAGIVVFNTPGANANAVKELIVCALMMTSRDVYGGIQWVQTLADRPDEVAALVEKGKSAFAGPEIQGKTLGVIGLGAVGVMVANAASKLGMTVYGYDPYLSVDAAWHLSHSINHAMELSTIYEKCDYITLHVPQNKETKGMINAEAINKMKGGVRILNFARGGLVNDDDIIVALENNKIARYITDFPDGRLVGRKNVICVPHLGASTPESEDNCAKMAAQELRDFLENGNISNSVNLPNVHMEPSGRGRMGIIHRNIPNMLNRILSTISGQNLNINNMTNKSKGEYAYTLIDFNDKMTEAMVSEVNKIEGVLRTTVIY